MSGRCLIIISITVMCIKLCSAKEKKYIPKCCQDGYYVKVEEFEYVCTEKAANYTNLTFSEVPLYDQLDNTMQVPIITGKILPEIYDLVPGKFKDSNFFKRCFDFSVPEAMRHNYYLTETGILYEEKPNSWPRWLTLNSSNFCIDIKLSQNNAPAVRFWTVVKPKERTIRLETKFPVVALLVSCVFLLLVLVVYCMLPELRNLNGLVQMAYVASFFWAFLLMAVMKLAVPAHMCLALTCSIYFFILSSFCWINIMSWDIWSSFRLSQSSHQWRHGHWYKFGMYCAYAWGLPLALTIMLIVLNSVNMRHMPWFITPGINGGVCFLEDIPQLLYFYVPMTILLSFNFVMYILTGLHLCRHFKSTGAILSSTTSTATGYHKNQRKKLMIFLKLFTIMGLSWFSETIGYFFPDSIVSDIFDYWNMLAGFLIFLLTVGTQKSTRNKLLNKLSMAWRRQHSEWQRSQFFGRLTSNSTNYSDTSESGFSGIQHQVCANPNGYA